MARTQITATAIRQLPSAQVLDVVAASQDLVGEAADPTNFNAVPNTGKEIIIAENLGAGAQTILVHAAPDQIARTGSITPPYSIGIGFVAILGPFPTSGYRQADGDLYIDCDSADIKIAIVRLP